MQLDNLDNDPFEKIDLAAKVPGRLKEMLVILSDFMKSIFRFLSAILFISCLAHAATAERLNILLIFADDLGWKDTGFNGSDFYETPNLDRLAKTGMVFNAAYAGAANCEPSRACLLSGQYTPRHGVYAVGSTDRGPDAQKRLTPIPNRDGLAPESVTFAEALKKAGYVTGIFGKWHEDGKDGAKPAAQGFDVVFQSQTGWNKKEEGNPKGIYSLTKAAGEFMENHKDRPFMLYLPHYAIHAGLQARQSTLEKFKAKNPGSQHNKSLYAACTYDLDDGIGMLLKKMADLGLDENTVVVFTSDNGGLPISSQEPLRGNKGCYYEGGIREPMIVRWPGVTQPGSRCDVPVISQDFYPTFLELAGVKPLQNGKLDGESLVPLFKGGDKMHRQAIFWHFPGYLDSPVNRGRDKVFRTRPVTVIRKGDWKLHLYHEEWVLDGGREKLTTNRAVELYNLAADIGERNNLANSDTVKRDELLGDLLKWMDTTKATLPTARKTGDVPVKPGAGQRKRARKNASPGKK